MLDDNLPTFRLQPCPDDPLRTIVYYARHGSEPAAAYLLQRPSPPSSRNQYALGLLDAQLPSLVYAEVAVTPEWSRPALSAAEVRATNGVSPSPAPVTPDSFAVALYDPDMSVAVRHRPATWNKSEAWEFEVPERSFRMPSASRIDRDSAGAQLAALAPKVVFRWKRDGRLSKDMTCYMSGRSVGGKKSKEPDITVAMFHAAKTEGAITIYEPNMARVDIEDLKGLELSLILGSVVIRDLYLSPRHDAFNMAGGPGPTQTNGQRKGSGSRPPPQAATAQPMYASGALPPPSAGTPRHPSRPRDGIRASTPTSPPRPSGCRPWSPRRTAGRAIARSAMPRSRSASRRCLTPRTKSAVVARPRWSVRRSGCAGSTAFRTPALVGASRRCHRGLARTSCPPGTAAVGEATGARKKRVVEPLSQQRTIGAR